MLSNAVLDLHYSLVIFVLFPNSLGITLLLHDMQSQVLKIPTKSSKENIMELTELKDLYVDELKDIFSAENQILKALPKMVKAATSPDLKSSFEEHLGQT